MAMNTKSRFFATPEKTRTNSFSLSVFLLNGRDYLDEHEDEDEND
jgi:hypothetical protein